MSPILPLFALLAVAAPATPQPSSGCRLDAVEHGRRLERTLAVGGTTRRFVLDVPDAVQPHAAVPLLLDFHGFGHSGAGVWKVSAFKELAARRGFITVYPEGLPVTLTIAGERREGAGWEMFTVDGNRDLAFVRALLDDLEARYCVDRRRIFSTGFSNGAFFSALLGCAMADRIAAVAPVSGGPLRVACRPARPVPILLQHGRQDPLIPVELARSARDDWLAIDGCPTAPPQSDGAACQRYDGCRDGATVEYCEEDYVHTWPPQATERVWDFVSRHPLPEH